MNKIALGLIALVILGFIVIFALNKHSTNVATEKCIITVFGNKYDVSSLRNTHSGGDIYKCGTDMTAEFQSEHGANVNRIAPYLVP